MTLGLVQVVLYSCFGSSHGEKLSLFRTKIRLFFLNELFQTNTHIEPAIKCNSKMAYEGGRGGGGHLVNYNLVRKLFVCRFVIICGG